jgi:hypothetical protein
LALRTGNGRLGSIAILPSIAVAISVVPGRFTRGLNSGIKSRRTWRAGRRIVWRKIANWLGNDRRFGNFCSNGARIFWTCARSLRSSSLQRLSLFPGDLNFAISVDERLPFIAVNGLVTHRVVGPPAILIEGICHYHAVFNSSVVDRHVLVNRHVSLLNPCARRPRILVIPAIAVGSHQVVVPVTLVAVFPPMVGINRIVAAPADVE